MGLFSAISWGVNSAILNAPIGTANKELDELMVIKSIKFQVAKSPIRE